MVSVIQTLALTYLRWRLRQGKVFSFWPAKDLRRDIQVADTSRLDQGVVGIRERTFGTLGSQVTIPPFGSVEFIPIREFRNRGMVL